MKKDSRSWLAKQFPSLSIFAPIWIPLVIGLLLVLTDTALKNGSIRFPGSRSTNNETESWPPLLPASNPYTFVSGGVTYPTPPIPPASFPLVQPVSAALAEIGGHRVEVNYEYTWQTRISTSGRTYTNTATEDVTMVKEKFQNGYDGDYILLKQNIPGTAIGSFLYHDGAKSNDPADLNAGLYFVRLENVSEPTPWGHVDFVYADQPEYQTYIDQIPSSTVTETERAVWKNGYLLDTSSPARDTEWVFQHPQLQDFQITVPAGWSVETKEDWSVYDQRFQFFDIATCGSDCTGIRLKKGDVDIDFVFVKNQYADNNVTSGIRCSTQVTAQEVGNWYRFLHAGHIRYSEQAMTNIQAIQTRGYRANDGNPWPDPRDSNWETVGDADYNICYLGTLRQITGTAPVRDSFFYWKMAEPIVNGSPTDEELTQLDTIVQSVQGIENWDETAWLNETPFPLPVFHPDNGTESFMQRQGTSNVLSFPELPGFSVTSGQGWELKVAGLANVAKRTDFFHPTLQTKLNWVKGDTILTIDLISEPNSGLPQVACSDTATIRDITTDWKRVESDLGYYYTIDGKYDLDTRLTDYWNNPVNQDGSSLGGRYSFDWSYLQNKRYAFCDLWVPIPLQSPGTNQSSLTYLTKPYVIGSPNATTLDEIDAIVKSITGLYFQD